MDKKTKDGRGRARRGGGRETEREGGKKIAINRQVLHRLSPEKINQFLVIVIERQIRVVVYS